MIFILIVTVVTSVLAVAGLLFGIPPLKLSSESDPETKLAHLDQWLHALHRRGKFSGVVLLAVRGEIIFGNGYGYADVEEREALTLHSSFNLASVSKQFTAAGIVLLKQRGQLSYSDGIHRFIPELACYSAVSIRHLLNHTSGIPDYIGLVEQHLDASEVVTPSKLIAIYARNEAPLRSAPGETFAYNNMGYVLLAEIIERASGHSFAEFMREELFHPLGMTHSAVFNLLVEEEPENRVYGFKKQYQLFGRKQPHDLNRFDGVAGDGGIYSSAYDLFQWHNALMEGAPVPVEEMDAAYQSGVLNNGAPTGYGFGWFINEDGTIEHAGGWQGFATYYCRDRTNDRLMIVLDNSGNIFRVTSRGGRYNSIPRNLARFLEQF